jgi:hypothetical protein
VAACHRAATPNPQPELIQVRPTEEALCGRALSGRRCRCVSSSIVIKRRAAPGDTSSRFEDCGPSTKSCQFGDMPSRNPSGGDSFTLRTLPM